MICPNIYEKALETYLGSYKYQEEGIVEETQSWSLVIGEELKEEPMGSGNYYVLANREELPYIIKLDRLSNANGKVLANV